MTILSGDIRFVKSQVMSDDPEGGGGPTGVVVPDGQSNAIFPDITEVDRAGGRVNLRKVALAVNTDDTDTFMRANLIVAEPPNDPNVSITLVGTNSLFDRRDDARNRMESYLTAGPRLSGFLLENHIAGQRSIQLFQRPADPPPPIGRTLMLVVDEGLSTEVSQYIRVTEVSVLVRTFTYNGDQDYQAAVVTCGLSDPLRHDFPGSPPARDFAGALGKTIIRDTTVADAANYCGVVALKQALSIGDLKAKCASIFTQLVPSAQSETPIVNASAAGEFPTLVDASSGNVVVTTSLPFNPSTSLYLGTPAMPGSVLIEYSGGTLVDGGGQILAGTTVVGTIDYARGTIAWASTSPGYSGTKTVRFKGAGAPLRLADSASIDVTQETRAYNYVLTLDKPPAPGTTLVSYMAQGNWYDLRDMGDGTLRGSDAAYGAGTVSYTTGTIVVSLGALPDIDTALIFNWGGKANYFNRSSASPQPPSIELSLAQGAALGVAITPGTLTLNWTAGTARTATDDSAGNLTGDATGTIDYATGLVNLVPAVLPAPGAVYTAAFSTRPVLEEVFVAPLRSPGGNIDLLLDNAPIRPRSVRLEWNVLIENYDAISTTPAEMQFRPLTDPYKRIRDDGAGVLRDSLGASYGTVNYTTGAVSLNPDTTVSVPYPRYSVVQIGTVGGASGVAVGGGGSSGNAAAPTPVYRNTFSHFEYIPAAAIFPVDESGKVTVTYASASGGTTTTANITAPGLVYDLTPSFSENIVPGSVNFTVGADSYFDRLGALYYQQNPLDGSATPAGTINYQTGLITIAAWTPGGASPLTLKSLLTTIDGQPVDEVTFRIPVAPIRPGSFQLLATKLVGGSINVTADGDGVLSGSNVMGFINYQTGVVRVRFGAMVVAAGNESAIWYTEEAIRADGKIFKPHPVFADTIRYNAVAFTYLPLDAELLGLDPVRLPQDGRVPIFRKGSFAVVGHKKSTSPATVSAGQTLNLARTRLSRVRVVGSDGATINTGYSANLEAGTVTFSDVTGYAQPVTIEDRIEDLMLVSDVQINGDLTFARQITHDYPYPGSYVSSALMVGDLKARVSSVFDQATWDGVSFKDTLEGAPALGTYNDLDHPIVVTNSGALTERWVLRFTSSTAFQVIGENVGVISVGNINSTTAPINPRTGQPYFTIPELGWGVGWAVGNILRINTVGAQAPVWLVRTVQQGPEAGEDYTFAILARGDVDNPL